MSHYSGQTVEAYFVERERKLAAELELMGPRVPGDPAFNKARATLVAKLVKTQKALAAMRQGVLFSAR